MKEEKVKEVKLDNSQILVISDSSRMISEDAYLVIMKARIEVPVKKDLFSEKELKEIVFDDVLDKVGSTAVYEYASERNFIMADEKEELFEKLVNDFFENLGKYISKESFPGKLILKQYKDIVDDKTSKIRVV